MKGSDRGDVLIRTDLCKGCALCVASCPPGVLSQTGELNRLGYHPIAYVGSGCTGCGICFYICPEPGAISVRVLKRVSESPEALNPQPA